MTKRRVEPILWLLFSGGGLVAAFVAVTVAPSRTLPVSSSMEPRISAPVSQAWAHTRLESTTRIARARRDARRHMVQASAPVLL